MFGNYRKMKDMEAVIASVMPSDVKTGGLRSFAGQDERRESGSGVCAGGGLFPTLADIVIDQGTGNDVNASGNDAAGMELERMQQETQMPEHLLPGHRMLLKPAHPMAEMQALRRMRLQRRPWYRSRLML